jgi:hypothetical protein
MIITATLPQDRIGEGIITWYSGSARCRGKADSQKAAAMGNPTRDPRKPWGDHPAGRYVITGVRAVPAEAAHSYGPFKIVLRVENLLSDDECADRENAEVGDDGILIHGGDPTTDGVSLRATYGCLRINNSTAIALAALIRAALATGEDISYVCEIR